MSGLTDLDKLFIEMSGDPPKPLPILTAIQLDELINSLKANGFDVTMVTGSALDYLTKMILGSESIQVILEDAKEDVEKGDVRVLNFSLGILLLAFWRHRAPNKPAVNEIFTDLLNDEHQNLINNGMVDWPWTIYLFLTGQLQ